MYNTFYMKRGFFDKCLAAALIALAFAVFFLSAEAWSAEKVTFDFVDVDLATVTKFVSEITGKNFIFDERVKGSITIIAPTKLSADDAFTLFTSVLDLKGLTVVPSGTNAYKIIPAVEARQSGIELSVEAPPVNETYIARLIQIEHISSEDAVRFLQPVVSKDGHISSFEPGNLMLAVDSGINMAKILSIVAAIDRPFVGEDAEIIFLKSASAKSVSNILNEGTVRRAAGAKAQAAAEPARAVADERLNAVVLFGSKALRESMKKLISLLDVPPKEAQGGINVYFLENADAEELSKVLEGIIKTARQPVGRPQEGAAPFEAAKDIAVTPDKATNSLVIVASQSDYQSLSNVIRQLDKRNRQVFVEAMITEASIDKLKELGTKWRAIARSEGEPVAIGGVGTVNYSSIQNIITGLAGMTIGGMGNFMSIPVTQPDGTVQDLTVPGFAALFSLSEFSGALNVLSTPQILTSDNKEAEIVVGENVPFITKREADPSRTLSVFSTIERKDVGITLRITPHITEGDYVKLDIYQEISSVKQDSETILTSVGPTTTKRSTKTSVTAKDNQTIVISGLMQEKDEDVVNKVPLLGDIPLLGWLFKQKSHSKKKTNLIVFLTPRIVKEAQDLADITEKKEKHFAEKGNIKKKDELSVSFAKDVPEEKALALIEGAGASVAERDAPAGLYRIRLKEGQGINEAIREFSSMPEVLSAEPVYKILSDD